MLAITVRHWPSLIFAGLGLGLALLLGTSSSGAPLPVTGSMFLAALVLLTVHWLQTTRHPEGRGLWAYRVPFLVALWVVVACVLGAWATGAPLVAQDTCSACKSNLHNVGSALEAYAADHGGAYPAELALLEGRYLRAIPRCRPENPSLFAKALFQATTGVRLTAYDYRRSVTPPSCVVWCPTGGHAWAGLPRGFPQYTSANGLVDRPTP